VQPKCNNNMKDRGLKEQLCQWSKRNVNKTLRQIIVLEAISIAKNYITIATVGILSGYKLDNRKFVVWILEGQECSLLHSVQTGSDAHPASYLIGTEEKNIHSPFAFMA
jgi:hypothetical protein